MNKNIETEHRQHAPLEKSFIKVSTSLQQFMDSQILSGVLLIIAAFVALALANSQFSHTYETLTELPLTLALGEWSISHSLQEWVNDGLMVLFFFILGLEIKYECLVGELNELKDATLVLSMAIGGMLLPALFYTLTLYLTGVDAFQGWGIPMATDTAFALGLLVMLGSKVPRSAAVILTGLAIVDDMGAVAIIGLFYTEQIHGNALIMALACLLMLILMNLLGLRKPVFYLIGGLVLWWFILQSGVHATTAGVLAALAVPTKPYADTAWFVVNIRKILKKYEKLDEDNKTILEDEQQHALAKQAEFVALQTTTPIQRWGKSLDKPVSLIILPVFALLNAGVSIPSTINGLSDSAVILAVMLGLILGKGIGISLFAWLSVKSGLARIPRDMKFSHIVGLAFLAGIGFTMSLFIATLAFEGQILLIAQAKLGILVGSLCSAIIGIVIFYFINNKNH